MEEKIREILKGILEDVDVTALTSETDLLEAEYLDSLGIAQLIPELEDTFAIGEIDGEDIVPENFESIGAIEALIARYQGK